MITATDSEVKAFTKHTQILATNNIYLGYWGEAKAEATTASLHSM